MAASKPASSQAVSTASSISVTAAETSQSTVSSPSGLSQPGVAAAQSLSIKSTDGNKASPGLPSPSNNLSPDGSSGSATGVALSSPSSSADTARASSSAASSASQVVGDDGGAALSAFQQARGSQRSEGSLPATSQKPSVDDATVVQQSSPSTIATIVPSAAGSVSATAIPTDLPVNTSASQLLSSIASESLQASASATSMSQPNTPAAAIVAPMGGFRGDSEVSDQVETSSDAQKIQGSSQSSSSIIGQVPTSVLDAPTQTSSASTLLDSQQSLARPSKEAFPDVTVGASKMAQGYNSVFQGLDATSKCDPNNKQEASACIRGQPGKCESDGTYTLISCDMGQTCYAVPKSNGESGVAVGCYTPKAYQAMISGDQSSAPNLQASQSPAQDQQASQASSAVVSRETAAPAPQALGGELAQSVSSAATATGNQNTEAQTTAIALSSSAQTAATTQSSALSSSIANVAPAAFAAHDDSGQTTGPAPDAFPQPKASVKGDDVPAVPPPAAIASPTVIPSPTPSNQASPNQQQVSESGPSAQPSPQSSSSQDDSGSAPAKGNDSNKNHVSKSDHSDDSDSKKDSKPDSKDKGVELSFPGSDSSESKDSSKGSKHDGSSGDHNNGAETNQKNVVAAADPVSSSVPLPTPSISPPGDAPAITPTPSAPADGFKGYITVTVTQTVTVHD